MLYFNYIESYNVSFQLLIAFFIQYCVVNKMECKLQRGIFLYLSQKISCFCLPLRNTSLLQVYTGTHIYAKLYFSDQNGSTQLETFLMPTTFLMSLLLYQLYAGINFFDFIATLHHIYLFICNYLFVTNFIYTISSNHWLLAVVTPWYV